MKSVDEEVSGTMEKLRATTNSFSHVSEYGDQDTNSHLPHAARSLFFEAVTWSGFNLTRHILSCLKTEFTDQMCNHKPVKATVAPRSQSVAILALQKLSVSFGR